MNNIDENFLKWKSRWISNILELFILFTISIKPRFGGELVELSKKYVDVRTKVPTVYAIIRRHTENGVFEKVKQVEKSDITRGKARVYYSLSADGEILVKLIRTHLDKNVDLQTMNMENILEEGI